jgi:hypothetical protein
MFVHYKKKKKEEKKKVEERELEMTKDLTFVTLYLGNFISFKITIVTNYFYFYVIL